MPKKRIFLSRDYAATNTEGVVTFEGHFICQTLELPNLGNMRNVSCIPEGEYPLVIRNTEKRGKHLWVTNVKNRSSILIHAGNDLDNHDGDTKIDSRGCICPNMRIETVQGRKNGLESSIAVKILNDLVFDLIADGHEVWLRIEKRVQ